ncbi:MAG TPA: hypothetical protein VFT36_02005, partial [Methylomirabilota bacterium]|nr:hypothetical protein [Methylomirabilota bacterium]
PVVGLAFAGLSSGTLAWLSHLSTVATAVVIVGMTAGVIYLGWRVGGARGSPAPLLGNVSDEPPFERGLRPRHPARGGSEGAVEAPSDRI